MEIRELRYFMEVAKELNITKAAQNLNMAQPPLSRQIQLLEDELGVKLFDRSKKKIQLTEEGKLLRIRGHEILELVEKTEAEVRELTKGVTGTLHIGSVDGRGPYIISTWLKRFRELYPGVCYDIYNGTTEDVIDRLEKGLLDVALIMEPFSTEIINYITVDKVPWIVMINKENPLANLPGDTIKLSQLKNETIFVPSRKERVSEINEWFKAAGVDFKAQGEIGSYLNARELTLQNVGVVLYPSTSGKSRNYDGFVEKRIAAPERVAYYALVWDKRKPLSVLGQRVVGLVNDEFKYVE